MGRGLLLLMLTVLLAGAGPACAQDPAGRFDGWATAVIAADWRDGGGQPIQAFDNARRDVARGLIEAGLPRDSLVDYSLRPDAAEPVTVAQALRGVAEATGRATRGCLLYFTSHGSPDGMVFGPDGELTPAAMAQLVRQWCGARPTVVIVSACYSGIFINALEAPNRMVLTAASARKSVAVGSVSITQPSNHGYVSPAPHPNEVRSRLAAVSTMRLGASRALMKLPE